MTLKSGMFIKSECLVLNFKRFDCFLSLFFSLSRNSTVDASYFETFDFKGLGLYMTHLIKRSSIKVIKVKFGTSSQIFLENKF